MSSMEEVAVIKMFGANAKAKVCPNNYQKPIVEGGKRVLAQLVGIDC